MFPSSVIFKYGKCVSHAHCRQLTINTGIARCTYVCMYHDSRVTVVELRGSFDERLAVLIDNWLDDVHSILVLCRRISGMSIIHDCV